MTVIRFGATFSVAELIIAKLKAISSYWQITNVQHPEANALFLIVAKGGRLPLCRVQ